MYCTFIYLQGRRRCSDSQTYPCTPWRRRRTVPAALGAVPRLGPPPPPRPHPPFVPETTAVLLLTSPRTDATPAAAIPAPTATSQHGGISLPMWNHGRRRPLLVYGRRGQSPASGPPTGAIVKQWRGRRPIWISAAERPIQRTETGQLWSTVTVQRNACKHFLLTCMFSDTLGVRLKTRFSKLLILLHALLRLF
jgi:hypothetical protein